MSAIAGLLHTDGRPVAPDTLDRMIAAAPPRGMDGARQWRSGPFGAIRFAHATTPEAVGEVQPFIGSSGAVGLLDGRLDNRDELLALLGASERLRDAPDGMLALALYEKMGRDFVQKLVGDFAVAIWEASERRLSLFRSPLGWRPLVWTFDGKTAAFATDARTLVVGLDLPRVLNEGVFAEFLSGRLVAETETFWGNIKRVPQGGAVILKDGRAEVWPWHGGPIEDWTDRSMADHVEAFQALFDQALTAATRSNGRVTSQLSGGLDSSSIVCRATELYRAGKLGRQIDVITARFPGQAHDETPWSRSVEEHLGITAEVATSVPFTSEQARQWCASTYHIPVRPNALDTMAGVVSILKADGRRVLLTGEGGDDWLNGSLAHWPDLLAKGRWRSLLQHGRQNWPDAPWVIAALKTMVTAARPHVLPRYRRAAVHPHLDWRIPDPHWLRPEWVKKVDLQDRWRRLLPRQGLDGFAQRSRYAVFTHGNRQAIAETALAYAESRGVEVRHPFHDARLTRFMMGAAGNHMRVLNRRKLILREAMRGTLPEMVRTRLDKAAFVNHSIDAHEMLLAERPVKDLLPVKLGWIDGDGIAALQTPYAKWRQEGSEGPLPNLPIGPVWFALATDMWLEHAFGLKG
ncbi:MAG TPA: asparagine synthase-related protein [Caulobacteraceae bacterium]